MGAHPTIPILSSSRMISVYDSHPTCDQDIRHFLPYDPMFIRRDCWEADSAMDTHTVTDPHSAMRLHTAMVPHT